MFYKAIFGRELEFCDTEMEKTKATFVPFFTVDLGGWRVKTHWNWSHDL